MKIKKILKGFTAVCASAAALASLSVCASAATADFEDGNYSFVTMKTDDGGDISELSIEEYNGSKQLKVDVQDCSLLPKVQFDLNAMVGTDNLSDINRITMDVTIVSKDGETPPGWIGGALGTAGENDTPAWDQSDYDGGEYENAAAETIVVERKFLLPSKKPVSGTPNTIALLMRWAAEVPYYMYIDNVTIWDADGNEIALAASSDTEEAAPVDDAEEAAPVDDADEADDAEEAAPVDDTAADVEVAAPAATEAADSAPVSDNTSAPAKTGNIPVTSIALITVCAAAAAAASKSRKK